MGLRWNPNGYGYDGRATCATARVDWTDTGYTVRIKSKPSRVLLSHTPVGDVTVLGPFATEDEAKMVADVTARITGV